MDAISNDFRSMGVLSARFGESLLRLEQMDGNTAEGGCSFPPVSSARWPATLQLAWGVVACRYDIEPPRREHKSKAPG